MASVAGKMGRMSVPDIHEQRLEILRKQAVERLRGRRAYRCPECDYRSFQRDCSRYGRDRDSGSDLAREATHRPEVAPAHPRGPGMGTYAVDYPGASRKSPSRTASCAESSRFPIPETLLT